LATQQLFGYLVTGLWTLLNIGIVVVIVVAIVALYIRLYKYLGKSGKPEKETSATPYSTTPKV